MTTVTEADLESTALDRMATVGWQTSHDPEIAPNTPGSERTPDYGQVVLKRRLRDAFTELNPRLPASALGDALRKLTRPEGTTLE